MLSNYRRKLLGLLGGLRMKKLKHIGRLARIYWSYAVKKETQPLHLPIRFWIEPTNACNLRCVMCPNSLDRSDLKRGFMEPSLFRRAIDEIKDFAYDMSVHHRGESLLHPGIFKMIEYTAKMGISTSLHTNATLLDENKSRMILKSGLDLLSFSFDGYEKETYERIRVNSYFDKTLRNIIRFLEIKKENDKKKPFTILEMIEFNEDDAKGKEDIKRNFRQKFRFLPLDKFIVKPPHNWAGSFPLEGQNDKSFTPHHQKATGATVGYPTWCSINPRMNRYEIPKGSTLRHTVQGSTPRPRLLSRGAGFTPCTFPWFSLTVFWDGTVVPCPQDFYGEYPLGNIKESSIKEIWHGERLRLLRERMVKKNLEGIRCCSECDMIKRSTFLRIPTPNLKRFLNENLFGYGVLRRIFEKRSECI